MSDVDWIFVVLLGLYLAESFVWLRPGTVAIGTWFGRFRDPGAPFRLIGNDTGVFILGGLAPWDATFLVEPSPLSISVDGVVAFVPSSPLQPDRRSGGAAEFDWRSLNSVTVEGRSVVCGDHLMCVTRSPASARSLASAVVRVAGCSDERRAAAVSELQAQAFDVAAVEELYQRWRSSTRRLRLASSGLFVWLLPFAALIHYGILPLPWERDATFVWSFLGIGLVWWWWAVVEAFVAHRQVLREDYGGRWKLFLSSLVSPPVAMRAADRIARDIPWMIHPAALFKAIGQQGLLEQHAPAMVRDLEYPRLPEVMPEHTADARAIIRSSEANTRESLERLLDSCGICYQDALRPPEIEDEAVKSYCPRCLDDYLADDAWCDACGSRPTLLYPSAADPAKAEASAG